MKKRQWSVLFYLNGNNEMAPEMEQSLEELKKSTTIDSDKNIIVEIGRAPAKLVNKIRSAEKLMYKESIGGVKRYVIKNDETKMVEDLNNINMADYKNLYKFIKWSINNFPAQRYMLVIAGHGFTVLTLSDLCGDMPYTMGLYEMCLAIRTIKKELDVQVDILNLDICNMNNIETIYEIGKDYKSAAKYMMTYIKDGPLGGMAYANILKSLNNRDTREILKEIVTSSEMELVAIKIDSKVLRKIKYLTDKLGYERLCELKERQENWQYLKSVYLEEIGKEIKKIIIAYKFINNPRPVINIIDNTKYRIENLSRFLEVYYKLSFSQKNHWASIVARKSLEDVLNNMKPKPRQEILTMDNVNSIVKLFNRNLTEQETLQITKEIYQMQKWNIRF